MKLGLPNFVGWQRGQWLLALSLMLLVTLTPLTWIQWRQYHLLDDLAANQVDSIMWHAYQLEREAARLKQSLVSVGDTALGVDASQLTERHAVFLSRIDLLTKIQRSELFTNSGEYQRATPLVEDFARSTDAVFATPQSLIDNRTLRLDIIEQLATLEAPLADLTRQASRSGARFVDQRNQQLRQQGLLVMGLAAAQIVILLLFAALLIRQIRRQQRQVGELQHLSHALETARDQAQAANRSKDVFLANMSHEIRTPFQGLLGMLNLLDDSALQPQQREYVQTATDSASHLLAVLNHILDLSSLESGAMKLVLAPTHLPSLAQEVNNLMQVAAREKGLALSISVDAGLPQWVMADATRLRQIMYNLINNAIKFTHEGAVAVSLTAHAGDGCNVLLCVKDSGDGMDSGTLAHLFTRFYQADNSLRRRGGGTGLGLEISRNLARLMGGDIEAQSQPGKGATFSVRLNLLPSSAPQAMHPASAVLAPIVGNKLHILVADDHPINRKYMKILLEKMGHESTSCENGREALECLEERAFDAIFLDYHMPLLDGLATTQAIRTIKGSKAQTPVILITADVVNGTRERALEAGVDAFVSKPLQLADLQRVIDQCRLGGRFLKASALEAAAPASQKSPKVGARIAAPYVDSAAFGEFLNMVPSSALDGMIATVFDAPQGSVNTLRLAIIEGNNADIAHHAHKLKGAAMLMGFPALTATAADIESLAEKAQAPIDSALVQQLMRDAEQTRKAIERPRLTDVF